ncbi:MAG TPA: GYD domain-containing protein [Acidimicrobiales bacterium]
MPSYLVQVAYTSESWSAMVKEPQNRLEKVRPVVEKLGGKFDHAWLAFGEYDLIGIVHLPENVDAAAFAIAVAAGGGCKAFKTTPLLGLDEGIEAMRRAQGAGYQKPGG